MPGINDTAEVVVISSSGPISPGGNSVQATCHGLWDLDGSLFHTDLQAHRPSWSAAVRKVLANNGLVLSDSAWLQIQTDVFGLPEPRAAIRMAELVYEMFGVRTSAQELTNLRVNFLRNDWTPYCGDGGIVPFEGVVDATNLVIQRGGRNSIVTSSCHSFVEWVIPTAGVHEQFPPDLWVCADHPEILAEELFKPELRPWEIALERAGARDGDFTFFVEDSVVMSVRLATAGLCSKGYLVPRNEIVAEQFKRELQRAEISKDQVLIVPNLHPLCADLQALLQ